MGAAQQILAAQKIAGGGSSLNTGITAYWNMDEVSGNRADSVGSLTLTDNNTVASMAGLISNASDFEATNSESLTNNSTAAIQLSAFTVAFWVRPESLTDFDGIAGLTSNGTNGWALTYRDNTRIRWYAALANQDYTHTLATGAWTLIVAGYSDSGDTQFVSVNGAAKTSVANATAITYGSSVLSIGLNVGTGANFFDGGIDEVGIWDRVLSDAEISELYNSGSGKTEPFT